MASTMRCWRTFLFTAAIGLVAIVPDARAARLSVEAPPSCAGAESLAEEVGTLIGQPLATSRETSDGAWPGSQTTLLVIATGAPPATRTPSRTLSESRRR